MSAPTTSATMRETDLTIVICTHNRRALLANTLESVYNAALPHDFSIDILVVANACTDDTASWVRTFSNEKKSSPLALRLIEEPTAGKSNALNAALEILNCRTAVFIDDDQRLDKKFLTETQRALTSCPDAMIICGKLIPDWQDQKPHWTSQESPYSIRPSPIPVYDLGNQARELQPDDELPPGGDLIIRRDVLLKVGKFATELGPKGHDLMGGEDTQFLRRALAQGFTIVYMPTLVQYHHVDPSRLQLGYLMRKAYQRSRAINRITPAPPSRIPIYFWNKLFQLAMRAIFSWRLDRSRHYLVRIAATLGEIRGIKDRMAQDK